MPRPGASDVASSVVAVGGTAVGNIETGGDQDWFAVELVAGRTYTIDLRGNGTGDGTLGDPYLHGIHDGEGNLISGTTSDNEGAGDNSRVIFTAADTGTYYIAAGAYSGQGTYEVAVTDTSLAADGGREDATDLGDITGSRPAAVSARGAGGRRRRGGLVPLRDHGSEGGGAPAWQWQPAPSQFCRPSALSTF